MKYLSLLIFSLFESTVSCQNDMSIDIIGNFDYTCRSMPLFY